MKPFFNQYADEISAEEVVREIDGNTAKLKKKEPKFYSITISPSQYELRKLQKSSTDLKKYTRELMKDYAAAFNREINERPVSIDDIKYYAKIEQQRTFKGTDIQIKENQPYATQILQLKTQIKNIREGRDQGIIKALEKKIAKLERDAPHQLNGKRIVQGMEKPGNQSHIHIIVSRKDASNSVSLSPGSKYRASEVEMHPVKDWNTLINQVDNGTVKKVKSVFEAYSQPDNTLLDEKNIRAKIASLFRK